MLEHRDVESAWKQYTYAPLTCVIKLRTLELRKWGIDFVRGGEGVINNTHPPRLEISTHGTQHARRGAAQNLNHFWAPVSPSV